MDPTADARVVRAQVGGRGRVIEFANTTHVAGSGNTICASFLVRRFVTHPAGPGSPDASCARRVPPIHTVGAYPDRLAAQPPLRPLPGSTTAGQPLRLAAAAVLTAGDAVARYDGIDGSSDIGLFGGAWQASDDGAVLSLRDDQLIRGVAVTGRIVLRDASDPQDGQVAVAALTASGPGLARGVFTARWTTGGAHASARVQGTVGGARVAGTMPAP